MNNWQTLFLLSVASGAVTSGCDKVKPFERYSPVVDRAIALFDAGDAAAPAEILEEYLSTGACDEGNIGAPKSLTDKNHASFDLGLALFRIAETYGNRFGEEKSLEKQDDKHLRELQVSCALRVVRATLIQPGLTAQLRLHALTLEGNLLFLNGAYKEAVSAYDKALALAPAWPDAGDSVSQDAAWNRAIALRRIEDEKDAGQDAAPDSPDDGGSDGSPDAGQDAKQDTGGGSDSGSDSGKQDPKDEDGGTGPDSGSNAGSPPKDMDERMLDELEKAPTVQKEAAKNNRKRVRATEDK